MAAVKKISFAALSLEFAASATTGKIFGNTSSGLLMIRCIQSSQSGQSSAAGIISESNVTGRLEVASSSHGSNRAAPNFECAAFVADPGSIAARTRGFTSGVTSDKPPILYLR